MKARTLTPALAILATLVCSSVALAQPAPATSIAPPATAGTLDAASGIDAGTSHSPVGLAIPSSDKIREYVDTVSAIHVAATYNADANRDQKLGVLEMKGGASIKLTADYSKKAGQNCATLDGITIEGDKVKASVLSFTRAEVLANGEIHVKLNRWLPELTVKSVEKQANGDVVFKGNWYTPNMTLTRSGEIKVLGKTLGRIDAELVALFHDGNWPPSAEDVAKLTGQLLSRPAADPNPLAALAGTLHYDVTGTTDGLPFTLDGKAIKAKSNLAVHGDTRLADGKFASIGDKNTARVTLDFGGQTLSNGKNGVTIKTGVATVEGKYRLDVPLKEPGKHAIVEFDGHAAYSGTATDLHVSLPNDAKIRIAQVDLTRDGKVSFRMNGDSRAFRADDGAYTATVSGPIKIEKLGPIESLEMDGTLHSQGMMKIRRDGLLVVNGDLKGSTEVDTNGYLALLRGEKGYCKVTVKKGSKLDVDAAKVSTAVSLPFPGSSAAASGAKTEVLGVDAAGKVTVHAGIGDAEIETGGNVIHAPDAAVDATVDGRVSVRGSAVTADAKVNAGVTTEAKGAVDATLPNGTRIKTSIDAGSHANVDAHVTLDPAAPATQGETATVVANKLNARSGPTLDSPVLRVLSKGDQLKVLSRTGNWALVESSQGEKFYVSAGWIRTNGSASRSQPVVHLDGRITGELGATDLDASVGPLDAKVKGHVKAGVDAPFAGTIAADGTPRFDASRTSANVPVRIDLKKGTVIRYNKKGAETAVSIDTDGSYLQLTGNVKVGPDGKPVVKQLDGVDVFLSLGPATAKLLGKSFDMPVEKVVKFKGKVVFRSNGVDVYGDFALEIHGDANTPIFRIDF